MPTERIDVAECAFRIVARPDRGTWSVLLADDDAVAAALLAELRTMDEPLPRHITWSGLSEFVVALRRPNEDTVVVTGLGALSSEEWGTLDLARSELERAGEVVLVMSSEAAGLFARSAIHLFSWVGGFVWPVDLDEERRRDAVAMERRLASLRHQFGMTDEEVVKKYRDGTLSAEPEFAEWLALLGRGDLLAPR
jgi:hypothetical protein